MSVSHRFSVEAEFSKGNWVNVYQGNNEAEAIRIANFWDEKINVVFTDRVREALNEQFKAEQEAVEEQARFDSLTLDEKFAEAEARVANQIEQSYNKAMLNLV